LATAHEVDGDFAQDGQIAGRRPIPDTAVILPEGDIEDPMEPIFGVSRSLRGMTLKASNQPVPFWADLLTSQYIAAGDAGETQHR
jgi:hypothetical protein